MCQFYGQTLLILFKIIKYLQFPISSKSSRNIISETAQGFWWMCCWDPECCVHTRQHLSLNFLKAAVSHAAVVWGGLSCPASSQNSCHGLNILYCEPGGAILLWNGFLESSNVPASVWDILVPTSWRTILKKKLSILKIDNTGQIGGGEGGCFHKSWTPSLRWWSSMRRLGDSLGVAAGEKGWVWGTLEKCPFGIDSACLVPVVYALCLGLFFSECTFIAEGFPHSPMFVFVF